MDDDENSLSDESVESEVHVPRLIADEEEDDSDKELQVAFKSGLLKPGMFRPITAPPPTVNNHEGLVQALENFKQTDLEWIERLDVTVQTSELLPENPSEETGDPREMDVHNDFKRETLFYEQAKEAVMQAMARLHADGVTTKRPDDYFAEMAKKDDHMKRVREKLMTLQRKRETAEKNRANFKLRKYGKQVQQAVAQERQQRKRELLKSVKKFRKGQTKNLDFLDESAEKNAPGKKMSQLQKLQQQQKLNPKRAQRNKKYGFGGKKRGLKSNNKKSVNEVSGFKKRVHANSKKKKNQRPGKNKRQKAKSKR